MTITQRGPPSRAASVARAASGARSTSGAMPTNQAAAFAIGQTSRMVVP